MSGVNHEFVGPVLPVLDRLESEGDIGSCGGS